MKLILVLEEDADATYDKLAESLLEAGYELVQAKGSEEAVRALQKQSFDLILCGLITSLRQVALLEKARSLQNDIQMVAISNCPLGEFLCHMIDGHYPVNIVAGNFPINIEEIKTTIHKLLTKDIFGMEKYLKPGFDREQTTITESLEKGECLDMLEAFARARGARESLVTNLLTVADELIVNAFFHAPKGRFEDLPRRTSVRLFPQEKITVSWGYDKVHFALSVEDPFGTLTQEEILDYAKRCYKKDTNQVLTTGQSSGLGLYTVIECLNHFAANIQPGVKTEILCLIDTRLKPREFEQQIRSFHVFTR